MLHQLLCSQSQRCDVIYRDFFAKDNGSVGNNTPSPHARLADPSGHGCQGSCSARLGAGLEQGQDTLQLELQSAGLEAAPASALGGTSSQKDWEPSGKTKSTYTNSQQSIKERESIGKGLLVLFQTQRIWGTRGELDKTGAGCWRGPPGWMVGSQQQHQE